MSSLKITRDGNFDNININGSYNVPIINSLIELQTMDTIGNIVFVNSENNFYFRLRNGWSPLGSGGGDIDKLTTKGDLLTFNNDYEKLPVGTNNQVLIADNNENTGLKWVDRDVHFVESILNSNYSFGNNETTWTAVNSSLSVTFVSDGRPIKLEANILCEPAIGGSIYFSFIRDSTPLTTTTSGYGVNRGNNIGRFRNVILLYVDNPGVGTFTYNVIHKSSLSGSIYSNTAYTTYMHAYHL